MLCCLFILEKMKGPEIWNSVGLAGAIFFFLTQFSTFIWILVAQVQS